MYGQVVEDTSPLHSALLYGQTVSLEENYGWVSVMTPELQPTQEGWLNGLKREINHQAPFAALGRYLMWCFFTDVYFSIEYDDVCGGKGNSVQFLMMVIIYVYIPQYSKASTMLEILKEGKEHLHFINGERGIFVISNTHIKRQLHPAFNPINILKNKTKNRNECGVQLLRSQSQTCSAQSAWTSHNSCWCLPWCARLFNLE
jgi:hypothetical protein